MSRIAKLAALLLLALWLPATLHCRLEIVGLDALFACADHGHEADGKHAEKDSCATDACGTVESGDFSLSKTRVAPAILPAPICLYVHCLLHVAPLAPALEIFAPSQTETLSLQRTWQFTRRAALPARAPDCVA